MTVPLQLVAAAALFLLGVRLSAFFSGSETGFYRLSVLRIGMDASAGDRAARRLTWYVQNPGYFVATTLIGNNVANYMVTLALGLAILAVYGSDSGWIEITATLLVSPIVFIFGELLPKNLYFRAPYHLLRRGARWFSIFYGLFLVVSFPLIWITRLFERFGPPSDRPLALVLGRSGLVQVLSRGQQEGLLTEIQGRIVQGLMTTAAQPVAGSIIPVNRVLGVSEEAARDEVLDYAKRYGVSIVALRRRGTEDEWYGYVRVVDLAVKRLPPGRLVRTMPRIEAAASKLEALLALRGAGQEYGVVYRGPVLLGLVSEHGLAEQLFRAPARL